MCLHCIGTAVYQGYCARQDYFNSRQLDAPKGLTYGIEKWSLKLKTIKNQIRSKKEVLLNDLDLEDKRLKKKIEMVVNEWRQAAINTRNKISSTKDNLFSKLSQPGNTTQTSLNNTNKIKKIKLLLIGDSLACGVGCEDEKNVGKYDGGPELPKMLAKILSAAFQIEIEWFSAGIIGATASDIRSQLIPEKRNEIFSTLFPSAESQSMKDETKLIVIVLCGLNDWRISLESFPWGTNGIVSFQSDLQLLVSDIKDLAKSANCNNYQVFLPAIPIDFIAHDPHCYFKTRPLRDVVEFIAWLWDMQKQAIARDDQEVNITFHFSRNYYFTDILVKNCLHRCP